MSMMNVGQSTIAFAAVALFAQATLAQDGQDPITLDVIAQDGAFYQAVIDRFEATGTPISVQLQAPAENYEEVAQRALRDALVGQSTDLVFMGYNRVRLAAERELAVPLDDLLDDDETLQTLGYLPNVLDLCRHDGTLYGLPFATSIPFVVYNADLVRQAGGDPDAFPDTWEGILELATRIDALDDDVMGVFFRFIHSGNWSWQALLTSHGGRIVSEDETQVAFDSPAGLRALEIMGQMQDAGMIDMTTTQARQSFIAGTVGIYFDSSSLLRRLTEQVTFDLRSAQYPQPVEGSFLPGGGNCVMLTTREPERQRAALEFMKFATGPAGQTTLVEATGYVSTNTIANTEPEYLGAFYEENPLFSTSVDALPRLTSWESFPGEHSLRITELIRDHLHAVIANDVAPQDALDAMAEDVSALMPQQ